jgi:lysophospholipase L1-like esterase
MRTLWLMVLLMAGAAWAATVPNNLPSSRRNAAAAVYNPSNDMAGMIAWYNPDTQAEADGDKIVQIHDRSGNGNHLIQTENTTRRASLETSEINGRATFRTDTASGMYRDSFNMPGDVAVFWATSNTLTRTVFNHDDYWVGNLFQNSVLLDYNEMIVGQRLPNVWGVFSFVQDGTGRIFRQNGVPISGWKSAEADGSGRLMLFAGQAYNFNFATDFGEFLIASNSTMTAQLREDHERYLCNKYGLPWGAAIDSKIRIYCDGDSITSGAGNNTEPGGDESWPTRLRAGLGSAYDVVNIAVSGQNLLNMSNDAPYQVHQLHGNGTNILVVWEYVNAIDASPYGGDTQGTMGTNEAFNAISNYCVQARNAGWTKIIVGTDFHTNQNVQNVSSRVRNEYANFADYLVELSSAALKAHSLTNGGDGIHIDSGGYQHAANAIANVVKTQIYP